MHQLKHLYFILFCACCQKAVPTRSILTAYASMVAKYSGPCFLSLTVLFSEEAQQLSGSIGSQGITERTISTPSRPDMARLVNQPLLHNGMTASIVVRRARVG